jgi:hypothetical protein
LPFFVRHRLERPNERQVDFNKKEIPELAESETTAELESSQSQRPATELTSMAAK